MDSILKYKYFLPLAYAKRDIQVKLKKNRIGFIAVDLE